MSAREVEWYFSSDSARHEGSERASTRVLLTRRLQREQGIRCNYLLQILRSHSCLHRSRLARWDCSWIFLLKSRASHGRLSSRLYLAQVAAGLGHAEAGSGPLGLSSAQMDQLTTPGHLDSLDPKQQICFDFTKGLCTRGEACKYSHDIALIVKVNSQERGICFDFLRGQCSRGLLCRFSHDLSNITSQSSQVEHPKAFIIVIHPCWC